MAESLMELEQQVRALPPHDRARLAEVLLESLQGPPLSDVERDLAALLHRLGSATDPPLRLAA